MKVKTLSLLLLSILPFTAAAQSAKVTVNQPSAIDKLLEFKKDETTATVYRIQIYDNIDPYKAEREKANFTATYFGWPAEIVWRTPNYKVWVGNFTTQLEADRALVKIKKKYMNAFRFEPKTD